MCGEDTYRNEEKIAEDYWRYRNAQGRESVARIIVWRPRREAGGSCEDWYCLVLVEGFTEKAIRAMGVGPVDALLNAARLIETFRESVGSVEPQGGVADTN